jgi:hypothetical protein
MSEHPRADTALMLVVWLFGSRWHSVAWAAVSALAVGAAAALRTGVVTGIELSVGFFVFEAVLGEFIGRDVRRNIARRNAATLR